MACLFSDWRQLPACTDALQIAGLVWRGIAVWDKINARPMPDRFRAQAEFVVWATNGPRDFDTKAAAWAVAEDAAEDAALAAAKNWQSEMLRQLISWEVVEQAISAYTRL